MFCETFKRQVKEKVQISFSIFFFSYWRREAMCTDVRMRVAISWDPCNSGDEIESVFQ